MLKDSSLSDKIHFEVNKTNAWKTIFIPISFFTGINFTNPVDIIGVVFSQNAHDGSKHTIYVDDIEFSSAKMASAVTARPIIISCKGYAKHVDISWRLFSDQAVKYVKIYRSENGKAIPVGIQSPVINRYTDYTGETGKSYSYKISFLNDQYKETALSNMVTAVTKAMTEINCSPWCRKHVSVIIGKARKTKWIGKRKYSGPHQYDCRRCFRLWHYGFDSGHGKKIYYP